MKRNLASDMPSRPGFGVATSVVRLAFEEYQRSNYSRALNLYEQASKKLGEAAFKANIFLCRKKIDELKRDRLIRFPKEIFVENSTNEYLNLSDNPVWIDFAADATDYIKLSFDVKYENIPDAERRKALILVEYLDGRGQILKSPYKGLGRSDTAGWFLYLAPPREGDAPIVLSPCEGTARVRLGFRSFYKKDRQHIRISRRIALKWHDNQPETRRGKPTVVTHPTLPSLPFEMVKKGPGRRLKVASILDPFSHACFEPECDLIPITHDNWRDQLVDQKIDFVLVESAWHGNNDSWLYRVASYAKPPGNELNDVVRWANKFDIPTVFWNKEDPPNFDRFIDRAKDFDFIFTTDANCIERYCERVGPLTRVAALPFAAQPKIHNPLLDRARASAASFAGTYYADDFEPRRRAMDMLLRAATRYGLDIFDRMHAVSGKDKSRYEFPGDLHQYIRGSLAYDEMIKAYRRYRVALNVNSVSDSPTMFSRRVFELLACGTPVVSTQSVGIDRIFKGLVPTVESEAEANETLESLMMNASNWLRVSALGIRAVFSEHTYAHRLNEIAHLVGLSDYKTTAPDVLVVVHPDGDAVGFADMVVKQMVRPQEVIVVESDHADAAVKRQLEALKGAGCNVVALPLANIVSYLRQRHPKAVVAACASSHYYGPGYLLDARISLEGMLEFDASTMHLDGDVNGFLSNLSFDMASQIGLPTNRAYGGTVVLRVQSELLGEALRWSGHGYVDIRDRHIRTRARYEFIPDFVASGVADPTVINLT